MRMIHHCIGTLHDGMVMHADLDRWFEFIAAGTQSFAKMRGKEIVR